LGYGETANTSYPVFAIGITDAVHVGAGGEHTCAVRSSGQVSCWGRNGYGEAGAAFSTWRLTPNPVADVTEGVMVAVGADHSCVLNDGLTVDMAQCWGRNNVHQIGNTAAGTSSFAAFWVDGVSDGVEIDSRENRTCIRRPDQTIWCWGGTISATYAMEPVTGVALAVGRAHTCTLRTGPPSVRPGCWGSNTYGQISTSGSGWGTTDAVQIIAGDHHTCARFADDTVWCWGRNSRGQLGTGMDSIGQVFVGLGVPLRASDISAGSNHTCAVTVAGSVVCWGENNDGQLGSGASGMLMSMFPVAVPGV
jgi:alpha-tubulin suppressor-like RCC1 family protein